jgi:hypothetical protein
MARNKDLSVMTSEESTDCAWCLTESGRELGNGSHGICEPHAELTYQQCRFDRTPSYVEQIAADRRSHSLFQR